MRRHAILDYAGEGACAAGFCYGAVYLLMHSKQVNFVQRRNSDTIHRVIVRNRAAKRRIGTRIPDFLRGLDHRESRRFAFLWHCRREFGNFLA